MVLSHLSDSWMETGRSWVDKSINAYNQKQEIVLYLKFVIPEEQT